MSIVLDTKFLPKVLENEYARVPWVEVMASLCPATQRRELREQLSHLDPSQTFAAFTLLEILDGMENAPAHV
jgi:hypothetical protein